MSTHIERSLIRHPRQVWHAPTLRWPGAGFRWLATLLLAALLAGGPYDRLPDPIEHPECWPRVI
jgi:hypothetical protein